MMNEPWSGFSFIARPHSRLMISWIASARRTDVLGRRGDRLVVGVGVQRVAVVVDRDQRLQRGADVVEVHLLRVQRPARRLHVVLQLLAALVGAVLLAHRDRPDAAGDAAEHGVLRVHAVGEEERQVRREVVDVHAAREVGLDVGEAVGERERELADRVRPGLGDVVAGDRHRVEVAHLVVRRTTPGCRPSPCSENSVEKMQVFWPWSSLRMSACTVPRTFASTHARIFGASSSVGSRPLSARNLSSCWSIAVLRNIARIVGAGPLIVIDTDVRRARTGRSRRRAPSCRRASRSRRRSCRPCRRCRGARRGRGRRA